MTTHSLSAVSGSLSPLPLMRPWMDEAEVMAVTSAIRSGWIAQGPQVSAFEREFSRALGVPNAVALSSGTSALEMALTLMGIGPGDDVLVPSLTFIATANAVSRVGARPVFADVSPTTGAVTATTLTQARTATTAAAIVVHQAGIPADVDAIALAIPDLPIIEDAACAAGSLTRGQPTGSQARLAAWSFHPRKLVTTGEGGMLTTTDVDLAQRARSLREHGTDSAAAVRHAMGSPARESYLARGFNMRMTDVQAALGRVQLTRLPHIVHRRRELAAVYAECLSADPRIRMMSDPDYGVTNFQSLWVRLSPEMSLTTSALLGHLHDHGITGRHGIMAVHRQPAYRDREHCPLPVTEELTDRSVILPLFHQMTHRDVERVCTCILEAVQQ